MRLGFFLVLLLTMTTTTSSVLASPLKLNYSLFFGYMKTIYKLDYEYVTTAFYLQDKDSGQACLIKNAQIVVDQKREPITFTTQGQLLPFYSQQHRKDGAMIEVELLAGQENYQCDLQVTLMAKEFESVQLSDPKLALISEQLEGILKKNAGMIGKYFLPTFSGVRLQLTEPLSKQQLSALPKQVNLSENGDLLISNVLLNSDLTDSTVLLKIDRITPWITP
ncbi:hypothetical protein Ping_1408 [Psychromonas ingrahamii 37]|uniref:DUF2987 domain-containing protein n=1 Tax=Psychromonas ingrahamii (strain DSM 17664 / CCUG 51855 / 37) TaxID=357804 RepID=A1SUR0_PSYIN|nr:DUF2987 domain-containing protein [Psychromonas ingrahamii]ABM03225.1 hypothetical protein Ping_1408 [Psychromonas ingrahamii 37]